MTTVSPSISIVINTMNRAALLENTLKSLRHLDYPTFEVIAVNGPSTDSTAELLEKWAPRNLKMESCPVSNLSMSRNVGIAAAAGDIIAFIDDDAIPEPEWLCQITAAFDSEEVAAAGGRVYDHSGYSFQYEYANATRLGHGLWQMRDPSPQYCYPCAFEFPYLQGTNTAFRRSALLEIGGFDENFIYYLDETDVCLRLIDRGYLVMQLHNAYVHHKYAPSHIRTKAAAKYRFPVLRSKIYFALRHAHEFLSEAEINEDNRAFIEQHRQDVKNCIVAGALTKADGQAFEEHAETALAEAQEAATRPARLLREAKPKPLQLFNVIDKPADGSLSIVLLCEDYPPALLGGIARFTQHKATALGNLGHKVHVIARSNGQSTVDFEDGVWVHRIAVEPRQRSARAAAANVQQSHWDQSQCFLDEIDRIATHRKVDIIEGPIWNSPGVAVLMSDRYKVVTSLMTTLALALPSRPDLTSNPETMKNVVQPIVDIERFMVENSHGILAISKAIAEEVEAAYKLKIPPEKLYVSHLGMPDWAANATISAGNRQQRVLFVGRLEKRKGIDVFLDCLPELLQKYPNIQIDIVGDDTLMLDKGRTYRANYERKQDRLDPRVVFHGKVDEAKLREHYANCDIFVAPSRFESFGLIYVEAMMYAKPVIGCIAGGIPEVVTDGVNGLLVKPDSPARLGSAIEKLLDDPELAKKMGKNGRLLYEQKFTAARMAEDSSGIYRTVIKSASLCATN